MIKIITKSLPEDSVPRTHDNIFIIKCSFTQRTDGTTKIYIKVF